MSKLDTTAGGCFGSYIGVGLSLCAVPFIILYGIGTAREWLKSDPTPVPVVSARTYSYDEQFKFAMEEGHFDHYSEFLKKGMRDPSPVIWENSRRTRDDSRDKFILTAIGSDISFHVANSKYRVSNPAGVSFVGQSQGVYLRALKAFIDPDFSVSSQTPLEGRVIDLSSSLSIDEMNEWFFSEARGRGMSAVLEVNPLKYFAGPDGRYLDSSVSDSEFSSECHLLYWAMRAHKERLFR